MFTKNMLSGLLLTLTLTSTWAADNLLSTKPWRLLPTSGAQGTLTKSTDGTRIIHKTNAQGVILFYMPIQEPQIVPGKTYTVEVEFQTSTPQTCGYLMLSMPGGKRTPFPVSKPTSHVKQFSKSALTFTARADEKKVRIHFCQRTPGQTIIRSIQLTELIQPANLLARRTPKWVVRKNEKSQGTMKQVADQLHLTKTTPVGYLAVIPEKNLPIFPGKTYQVTMKVKKLDAQVTGGMMLSMPGSKRTPYPFVRLSGAPEQIETLTYKFTARSDEKYLRPHLIVRGQGQVVLLEVQCQELPATSAK